ncbi:hypothetical protein [Dyella monticola]|uniref:hypothetical protein n=1 Tax=Dyella monticola TaxID=1927958 RepID=UPI001314B93A|nr:hypothetical protein [Dyella monticola]
MKKSARVVLFFCLAATLNTARLAAYLTGGRVAIQRKFLPCGRPSKKNGRHEGTRE